MTKTGLVRRFGARGDPLMMRYHDEEWREGPLHDDLALFEFLVLDGFQSGLSWRTMPHKREAFRESFHNGELPGLDRGSVGSMQVAWWSSHPTLSDR